MSSLRSVLLLFLVTLSITVLAAPVVQSSGAPGTGIDPGSGSGSPQPFASSTGQPGSTAAAPNDDDGDALIETIAPVGNGDLNGNKVITSVNTLNDVLSNDLNNSTVLSNILSNNDNNSIDLGIKRRRHVFKA